MELAEAGAGAGGGERHVRFADGPTSFAATTAPVLAMDDTGFVFPESAVTVSTQVLGRGAFGEVRVGTWRNCQIACKRLHSAALAKDEQALVLADDVEALHREIAMLSRLRHPNLVLFLGACFDKKSKQPTLLLTELMSASLYDVLETHKVTLTLPEVLDISLDVARGLAYLHSHDPAIIHRDVSCKNILLHGSRAKIADLGQARFFRPAASSSSSAAAAAKNSVGLPGAMAYTAPELLSASGSKYSEKLDLFALGVLLVQMCTGEYPRIDAREQQMRAAVKAMPPLSALMHALLSFLPSERPSAAEVCTDLEAIRANDRFYPIARLPPSSAESQLGVLTRRWVDQLVESSSAALSKKIHQSYSMLQAEGRRWQDQYRRADTLEGTVTELQEQLEYVSDRLLARDEAFDALAAKHSATEAELAALRESSEKQAAALGADKAALTDMVRGLEHQVHEARAKLQHFGAVVPELESRLRQRDDALVAARSEARQNQAEIKNLQRRVEEHEADGSELEARLEQALTRWKKEQETCQEVKLDFVRLRVTCTTLIEQKQRLEAELKETQGWLRAREEAQLPESVQQQIARLQQDLSLSAEAGQRLVEAREAAERELAEQRLAAEGLREALAASEAAVGAKDKLLQGKEALVGRLRLELTESEEDLQKQEREAEAREQALKDRLAKALKRAGQRQRRRRGGGGGADQLSAGPAEGEGEGEDEDDYDDYDEENYGNDAGGAGEGEAQRPDSPSALAREAADPLPDDDAPPGPSSRASPTKFSFADLVASAKTTTKSRAAHEEGAAERAEIAASNAKLDAEKAAKVRVRVTEETAGAAGLARLFVEQADDHCMLWRAARALRPLVNKGDNAAQCQAAGVDTAAVAALQRFADLASVQGQVLQLLGAVAYGSDLVRRRSGERGAMACVCRALEAFGQRDELVVLHALTALTNLCHNSPDNRHRFLDARGMEALVGVMEHHSAAPKVQRQGCWALLTLAGSDDTGRLVAQAGGGTVVVNAMLTHRLEAGVQQFGLWAISNMALAGGDVTRRLRKGGCLEACRIALETHPGDAEVVRQARHMMSILGPPPPALKPPPKNT